MKILPALLVFSLLAPTGAALAQNSAAARDAADTLQPSAAPAAPAAAPCGESVAALVAAGHAPEVVAAKVVNSPCGLDSSPEGLKRLREAGVPDAVILAVVMAPKPPPAAAPRRAAAQPVPEGSLVELETAHTINSQHVRAGEAISFRVVNPVRVGGVTVIEQGATATGRVVKASRGGHFGRAGRLAWEIVEVTAVDGTRVPLVFSGRVVGDSKGAKVATQTALAALAFGPLAPLALLHGFKRGENAFVLEGKRFEVYVRGATTVSVPEPR